MIEVTTFKVIHRVEHNGEVYEKDSVFTGEIAEFEHLVKSGVLAIDGETEDTEEVEDDTTPEVNTWGPQPDPVVGDEKKDTAPEDVVAPETVVKTHEEMVAELGEDKVAEIEKNAEVVDAPKDAPVIDSDNL